MSDTDRTPFSGRAEDLWKRCKTAGIPRRRFLELLSSGGAAAVLAACGQPPSEEVRELPWVKDPEPFIRHPTNLETRLENLTGLLTPERQFFVRNHAPTPRVEASTYRLRIEGDAVERPIDLSYDDLLKLPSQTVVAYLECAGNWRSFFARVAGRAASGGQWSTGAVGCASWTGPSLAHVLERAGIGHSAVEVNLYGTDEGSFNKPMPMAKALDSDTILALAMNGSELPPDHGFPVRAVVPGWAGSNSVKWLGRIEVSSSPFAVKNTTTSYVLIGPEWPAERYAPARGRPVTELNVKSVLALPWPARLQAGPQLLRGYAYSPAGPIRKIEWRADGADWREARLVGPTLPLAWTRFELDWNVSSGSHVVEVRAIDRAGNTQPESVPFNEKGYLYNVPLPHPIEVA